MVELDIKNIKLVETDEVKTGRGGGKKGSGEKYGKYVDAIKEKKVGEWLKEQIQASKHGTVRIKIEEIANACGMQMRKHKDDDGLHPTSLYWGFKYALFHEGFKVGTGTTKKDEPLLIIKIKKPGDKLPASLRDKTVENGVSEEEIGKEEEKETDNKEEEKEKEKIDNKEEEKEKEEKEETDNKT